MSSTNASSVDPSRHPLLVRLLSPRVRIPFGLLLAAVTAPFAYRMSRLNGVPRIEVFDVEQFLDVEVDPNAGCWPGFRRADRLLAATDAWSDDEAELRTTLAKHPVAVETWRDAAFAEYRPQRHPGDLRLNDTLPIASRVRQFARLARVAAADAVSEGRMRSAWLWYEGTLRTSRHLAHGACTIERLAAAALPAIVANSIADWAGDDRVTVVELREARRALADVELATPSITDAVKLEYMMTRRWLEETPLSEFGGPSDPTPTWLDNEPELGRRLVDHMFAHALEAAPLGWHNLQHRMDGSFLRDPGHPDVLAGEELKRAVLGSPVASVAGFGAIRTLPLISARETATIRALDVILAAELYRRRTGAYPRVAGDLVPDLLNGVPDDPFAATGTAMRYRIEDGRPHVWSIGPNGVDEDGVSDESDAPDDVGVPWTEP